MVARKNNYSKHHNVDITDNLKIVMIPNQFFDFVHSKKLAHDLYHIIFVFISFIEKINFFSVICIFGCFTSDIPNFFSILIWSFIFHSGYYLSFFFLLCFKYFSI